VHGQLVTQFPGEPPFLESFFQRRSRRTATDPEPTEATGTGTLG
jgi:hypothetical protein